jgi:hypothetical protein
MVHFQGQFVTRGEADDLHICHDSRRPAWLSDQNRQIRDIKDYYNTNIRDIIQSMKIGIPLNRYFTATYAPLYPIIPRRNETAVDLFFTCWQKASELHFFSK